jgi:ferric-dicitrate binding protein FerR (iron transport regulator)
VTPTDPNDLRLYDLFVRYWDNALTPTEQDELNAHLAADAQARERFHLFTLQAVVAADRPALEPVSDASTSRDITPQPLPRVAVARQATAAGTDVSRRRMMQFVGGGLAAGLGGAGLGWWLWPGPTDGPRLRNVQGTVVVQDTSGKAVSADGPIPSGGTISTYGLGSSVMIAYPDGSGITLTGDSSVKVGEQSRRILVHRGAVSASVRPQAVGTDVFTLLTSQVTFAGLSGVLMTLGEGLQATELLVYQGMVAASHPTGEPLAVVREGESLTVYHGGDHKKKPIVPTPEEYSWNLAEPLPKGWPVGRRDITPQGMPYVRPEFWPDPYYQNTEMYQIRSPSVWLHGFFRLAPDSVIRVRYWVDRPGKGQVCFCARTTQSRAPDTGMLEWNGTFGEKGAQEWQWLEVTAEEMLRPPNKHIPKFEPPWIGFLFIFNTYTIDLGLKVAELRVARPGAARPG